MLYDIRPKERIFTIDPKMGNIINYVNIIDIKIRPTNEIFLETYVKKVKTTIAVKNL